jgi:hypothetical protein
MTGGDAGRQLAPQFLLRHAPRQFAQRRRASVLAQALPVDFVTHGAVARDDCFTLTRQAGLSRRIVDCEQAEE